VKQLVQVCYDASSPEAQEREVRALLRASRELKCKNLLVINYDREGTEAVKWFGMKGRIKYVPLWKWLLS